LVTGVAGFIGSHLAETLLRNGDEVVGVDSFTDYYPRQVKQRNLEAALEAGLELIEADLSKTELAPLVLRSDGVFHLAAQPGVRGSWGDTFEIYVRDNELATQRVFEAAARAGVRVVFASSSSIYGNIDTYPTRENAVAHPVSPYGVTKLACEKLAEAYAASRSLDVVALRYFTVYGPRQRPDMAFSRVLRALLEGRPFTILGDGEQSRDFTFVQDAVAATVAAMNDAAASRVYNVGGGEEASLRQVIVLAERLTGRRLELCIKSPAIGDVRRTVADTSLIRSELRWQPQTPLEDGIERQRRWLETQANL